MNILSLRSPAKLSLAIAALVGVNSSASASVMYDVRATAVNGVPLPAAFAKGGFPLAINDTVTFTVYADVTGAAGNGGAEGFQAGFFSLLSTTAAGGTSGAFVAGTVLPAFATGAFNGGTLTDTNSDGINDRIGGQRTIAAQSTAPFDITVRSGTTPKYDGTPIPDGMEFALSTADFHILVLGDLLSVNVAPSIFLSGIGASKFSATWAEDTTGGTASANRVGGFQTLAQSAANTGRIDIGAPVQFQSVPEPSAFGMVLLGAMGVVGARRLGVRRV